LAENNLNQAYKIALKINEPKSLQIADLLHNKALFLRLRKSFKKSRDCFKKAIEIMANTKESSDIEVTINGLAYVYRNIGDYQKALDTFKYAIEIADKDDENLAPFYYDLARTQKMANKIEEAYQTYQKSITTAQKMIAQKELENHKFYEQIIYNCNNDISEIELNKFDLKQAKHYHAKALKVLNDSAHPVNTFFEGYKRFEIPAKIYIQEEKYEKAIEQLQKAKAAVIEEYKGFEVGKDLAKIIHQIGDCYINLEQYDKALAIYQEALITVCNNFQNEDINALPTIENIYNKRSAIASLSYKAATLLSIFEEQNKIKALEQAYQSYQLITELIPVTRRDYVEENSKFQLADETKGIYEKAIETCLNLHRLKNDEAYLQQAFYFAESSKAIVLQENLQANFALDDMEESIQQQDISYRSKIAFYENSINTNKTIAGNKAKIETWKKERYKCKEAYEDFLKQIENNYPNYYTAKYAHSIAPVASVQKIFTPGTALIEYFIGHKCIYVFIITNEQFNVRTIQIDQTLLKKDIQQFKQFTEQPDRSGSLETYNAFKTTAYKLYKNLLSDSLKQLSSSIQRLIIIPDGLLYNIAFDTLLFRNNENNPAAFYSNKNLDYLNNHFAISYNYSSSLLLNTLSVSNKNHESIFTGFAPGFENLSSNIEEIQLIEKYIGGEAMTNESANFEYFKKRATKSKILHLSTHAKQSKENHKLSEIYFSDCSITNFHIENMKITADLAVLSACETAAGLIQNGEGAMSLARSFFLAGCPSLVASQWRANDAGTTEIIQHFYQNLKNGDRKDVALQKAKLQYCDDAGIRNSHPFYWACLQQYGNRKALF